MPTHKPRLLILTPDFPPAYGGVQTLLWGLCRYLDGWEIEVVTQTNPGDHVFDAQAGAKVHRTGPKRAPHGVRMASLNLAAVSSCHTRRPAVVLSGHIVTAPSAMVASRFGIPFVQYLHAEEVRLRPRLTRAAVRRAGAAVAVTEHTRAMAAAGGSDPERISVIPPGVELPDSSAPTPRGGPMLITVARLDDASKGHLIVLEALRSLRGAFPALRWVVVGDGPFRPCLERRVCELGLSEAVELTGWLGPAARDERLRGAHLFVMLTLSRRRAGGSGEGVGTVYVEAAAHGLPSVAGNAGGESEAVIDGRTGRLVPPDDPLRLAEVLHSMLDDRLSLDAMRIAAADHARTFAWANIAPRVHSILEEASRASVNRY